MIEIGIGEKLNGGEVSDRELLDVSLFVNGVGYVFY